MKHESIYSTLEALNYQQRIGVTTLSPCFRCGQPARGRGPCVACLAKELLTDWHIPADLVKSLMDAHDAARQNLGKLEDVRSLVIKAAGG